MSSEFPVRSFQPKDVTQALLFLSKYPQYNGSGVTVAVFDTGIDPGAPGLQITPDGSPKVVDIIDATGSGDVDCSHVVTVRDDNTILGLTGRTLILGDWDNPSGKYHIGIKNILDLYPTGLKSRINSEKQKEFNLHQRDLINNLQKRVATYDNEKESESKEELLSRIEFLESFNYKDNGTIMDCVVFRDSQNIWRAAIDTTFTGDMREVQVLCDYSIEYQYATFSEMDLLNYSINIYDDGNTLSIVTNAGSHGTHVAGTIAAYFPEDPDLNGIAPGAQLVSVKIGDHRLGSMETGPGLIRAIIASKKANVDLINMSYGEPSSVSNIGKFAEISRKLVVEDGVIFVASAGNDGPGLSTVGSPGSTTEHLIGVGAMVTPEMMDVDYSMRERLPAQQYTWSSRGPTEDGSLGVTISAPGGAISPIPNWTLSKTQLMNGTSMASPNACGCIALVISGLKQLGLPYNPIIVKQAIQNTALFEKGNDYWTRGYGIIQVNETLEYLREYTEEHTPFIKAVGVSNERGIYLRERYEVQTPTEITIKISTDFNESVNNREKINYEKRITLVSTQPWVIVPEHLVLMNMERNFKVLVDPTNLKDGRPYYAEIQGFDSENPQMGPIIRYPVTVIKPRSVPSLIYEKQDLSYSPGKIKRFFLDVPTSCTWADIRIKSNNIDQKKLFNLQWIQIVPNQSTKLTMGDKYIWLNGNDEKSYQISIQGGSTLEVVLSQFWSQIGSSGTVDIAIEFHGYVVNSKLPLHMAGNSPVNMYLINPLRDENFKPKASLAVVQRQLFPVSSKISPLSLDRDILFDGNLIQQLVNTYKFTLSNTISVLPRMSLFDKLLYESPYGSQFWMIFNEHNKMVHCGDFMPEYSSLPSGTYTLTISIRHEDVSKLKKLQKTPIQLEMQIPQKEHISLDIFSSPINALTGSSKITSNLILRKGVLRNILICSPDESKLPKYVQNGDVLLGFILFRESSEDIQIPKNGILDIPGATNIFYTVQKSTSTSSNSTKSDKSILEQYHEQQISMTNNLLQKLLENEKYEDFSLLVEGNDLMSKYGEDLSISLTYLQYLDKTKKIEDGDLIRLIEETDRVLDLTNELELAAFFGVKHTAKEKSQVTEMEEKKKNRISVLKIRSLAFSSLITLNPDDETYREQFKSTNAELRKWIDVDKEAKEIVEAEYKAENKLAALAKHYKANLNDKETYKKLIDLMKRLNWDHLATYYENEQQLNYPQNITTY